MIINNPQDLTPLLTAMREGLQADMNALTANVQAANNALSQSVSADMDALTVVNGEISTEVQAINAHTSSELAALSLSPIKAIYRVSHNGSGVLTIPSVNLDKAVVILNSTAFATQSGSYGGDRNALSVKLTSETELTFTGVMRYYSSGSNRTTNVTLHAEVIEYA